MIIYYRSYRYIDGKSRWVIVDENGKIVNKNPSKEELKDLKEGPYKRGGSMHRPRRYYTYKKLLTYFDRFYEENRRVPVCNDFDNNPIYPSSGTCKKVFGSWNNAIRDSGLWDKRYNEDNKCEFIDTDGKRCTENLDIGNARQFDIDGKLVWYCKKHGNIYYERNDPNSLANMRKSLRNCRTRNQNPNHESTKGDRCIDLACELYGYIDLNKRYDNYTTEIDCQDPITGLLYQIRGKRYNPINRRWDSGNLENEWYKYYEDMVYFCLSKDGKIIDRIYKFPSWEIMKRKSISIYNNENEHWYDEYRIEDPDKLRKVNETWQKILEKENKRFKGE